MAWPDDALLCASVMHVQHLVRVVALLAEHELLDESLQKVLHLSAVVVPVHDVALVLDVPLRLGPELAPEVLGDISGVSVQCGGDGKHIYTHRLDPGLLALKPRHLVSIEVVRDEDSPHVQLDVVILVEGLAGLIVGDEQKGLGGDLSLGGEVSLGAGTILIAVDGLVGLVQEVLRQHSWTGLNRRSEHNYRKNV